VEAGGSKRPTTELIDELERRYDIHIVDDPAPLAGGYENDVYRLGTDRGAFAVRICAPWIDSARVRSEHGILCALAPEVREVHPPVADRSGATFFLHDDRVVCVFPFVGGRAIERDDDDLRSQAAAVLARIHIVGRDYAGDPVLVSMHEMDWDDNTFWTVDRVNAAITQLETSQSEVARSFAAQSGRIEAERRWAQERVGALAASCATGVVQGDYWPGNVLAQGGRVTGVLDWLESRRDLLVLELGRSVWEFCSDRREHTLIRERAHAFLRAYRAAGGPVDPDEFGALIDAMRVNVLADMLRDLAYTDAEEAATYHTGSLRRLDHLAACPPLDGKEIEP
jgi:homoserine kinase type II